jgi:hypothetical protein
LLASGDGAALLGHDPSTRRLGCQRPKGRARTPAALSGGPGFEFQGDYRGQNLVPCRHTRSRRLCPPTVVVGPSVLKRIRATASSKTCGVVGKANCCLWAHSTVCSQPNCSLWAHSTVCSQPNWTAGCCQDGEVAQNKRSFEMLLCRCPPRSVTGSVLEDPGGGKDSLSSAHRPDWLLFPHAQPPTHWIPPAAAGIIPPLLHTSSRCGV